MEKHALTQSQDIQKKKNILFITTKTPLPMNDGHTLRSFNLIKQASLENHIHLLSFVKFTQEHQYLSELQTLCSSVRLINVAENISKLALATTLLRSLLQRKSFLECKYDKPEMHQAIADVLAREQIDLIHLDMLPLGVYLGEVENYPLVLDEHNVESTRVTRQANTKTNVVERSFYTRQAQWLEQFEKKIANKVDHILACSDIDADMLRQFAPKTATTVIPNSVDFSYFHPLNTTTEEQDELVFVGGLDWFPNLDALQWFDQEVLPALLTKHPDITIHVIGGGNPPHWEHSRNIHCHGRVEDIRPHVARAAIFIAPLRIGGGTRLKILNAMAMQKCVISTTIGAEGLNTTADENILIADSALQFAETISTHLAQKEKREIIANNAWQFVQQHYDWEKTGSTLRKVYQETINTHNTYSERHA